MTTYVGNKGTRYYAFVSRWRPSDACNFLRSSHGRALQSDDFFSLPKPLLDISAVELAHQMDDYFWLMGMHPCPGDKRRVSPASALGMLGAASTDGFFDFIASCLRRFESELARSIHEPISTEYKYYLIASLASWRYWNDKDHTRERLFVIRSLVASSSCAQDQPYCLVPA